MRGRSRIAVSSIALRVLSRPRVSDDGGSCTTVDGDNGIRELRNVSTPAGLCVSGTWREAARVTEWRTSPAFIEVFFKFFFILVFFLSQVVLHHVRTQAFTHARTHCSFDDNRARASIACYQGVLYTAMGVDRPFRGACDKSVLVPWVLPIPEIILNQTARPESWTDLYTHKVEFEWVEIVVKVCQIGKVTFFI